MIAKTLPECLSVLAKPSDDVRIGCSSLKFGKFGINDLDLRLDPPAICKIVKNPNLTRLTSD